MVSGQGQHSPACFCEFGVKLALEQLVVVDWSLRYTGRVHSMVWRFQCIMFSDRLFNLDRDSIARHHLLTTGKPRQPQSRLAIARSIELRHSFRPCHRRLCPGNLRPRPWSTSAPICAPSHPFHHDRPASPSITCISFHSSSSPALGNTSLRDDTMPFSGEGGGLTGV